jgi:GDP-4-dehydro-6-deoxy-D-mannose reductase
MSHRLHTVRTRGFNHTGPRRGDVFVTSNFARQIAEAEKGLREPAILVGNLEAIRDFTDVRDMVRAYWLALDRGEPGEVYNVCSGRGYTIRAMLDILRGLAQTKVDVRPDPSRLRPSDVEVLIGDCTRFERLCGWHPTIPLEVSLKDLLDYWRQRV